MSPFQGWSFAGPGAQITTTRASPLHPSTPPRPTTTTTAHPSAAFIARFVKSKGLLQPYNTRVFKRGPSPGSGAPHYTIRLASAVTTAEPAGAAGGVGAISGKAFDDVEGHLHLGEHAFEGASITIERGDYAPLLARVCGHLAAAQAHAATPPQVCVCVCVRAGGWG